MANEIRIVLTQKGFFAGRTTKDGTLSPGAHKITEDEIMTMFSTIMRTYRAKTGQDTLVLPGDDGKVVAAKIIEVRQQAGGQEAEAAGVPKKKRTRRKTSGA